MADHYVALNQGITGEKYSDFSTNTAPTSKPANWASGTTYNAGQQVFSPTTGLIYSSIAAGNVGNDPATDGGVHWTSNGAPTQIELRVQDGAGLSKKDVYLALKSFERFFENAQQVAAAGFSVSG
jgi:hypothetical protein